jgi:HEAT repeat protein
MTNDASPEIDKLIEELNSDDYNDRGVAAEALGASGDARAVVPLIAVLEDDNVYVRRAATRALGASDDARAVEPLIAALGNDFKYNWSRDWRVRRTAARALGMSGDVRAVVPLIAAIGDDNVYVRRAAAEVLRDNNVYVRRAAAEVLGASGDARAVEPLIAALGDDNVYIRRTAAKVLEDVLGGCGDVRAVQWLIKMLKQGQSDVVPFLEKMSPSVVGAEYERLALYDDAEEWYTSHGMMEEAAAVRRKKANMIAPKTEVHGDYIDDRDTIVKDSVISRSNVGPGIKSKAEELRDAKALLDDGIIDAFEFKQMKKEILGK